MQRFDVGNIGLNIFYSEEKDWARHTTRQCPLHVGNIAHAMRSSSTCITKLIHSNISEDICEPWINS